MIEQMWSRASPVQPRIIGDAVADPRWYHQRLPGYRPTALYELPELAADLAVKRLWVKHEASRFGLPSFKGLGASWAAYRLVEQRIGRDLRDEWSTLDELRALLSEHSGLTLVTATDGNHGRAVARFAALFGMSAHIYVPHATAPARVQAIRDEGARVEETELSYDATVQLAASTATENRLVLSDTSWPGYEQVPAWISEGYSTMFHEVFDSLATAGAPAPDFVFVPVGVGALAAAAIQHLAHLPTQVVAVEPVGGDCVTGSLKAGRRVTVPGPQNSEMVGLNCGTPSFGTWPSLQARLRGSIVISDDPMHDAMRRLAQQGISVGETGAAALGALIALRAADAPTRTKLTVPADASVLILSTEGVTDPANYQTVVGRSADEVERSGRAPQPAS